MPELFVFTEFEEVEKFLPRETFVRQPSEGVLCFGKESSRARCTEAGGFFVLTGSGLNVEQIQKSRTKHKDFSSFELNQSRERLDLGLKVLCFEAERKRRLQALRSRWIGENQKLQALRDQEGLKRRRLEEGRRQKSLALKKAGAQLRKRIFFLKQLNEAVDIKEVASMIQEEARKTRGLGNVIITLFKGNQTRIFYVAGRQILEKRAGAKAISGSSASWRQYLADQLNRPVGPLIHLEGSKSNFGLFFEHQLSTDSLKEVIAEWKGRMVGFELAMDRFQLAQDLEEAALFWEKTFDGLGEPIGIFDGHHQVIRANQLFSAELMSHLEDRLIRLGSRVFRVESYDIHREREVAQGSKVIHLTDQTSSFQLKQHVIQTEKIAALGQLAGHIAHELNNPLTGIRSLCQMLIRDEKLGEEMRQDISEVEAATARCQNIIRNLLEYSRPHGEDQRVAADVNEVIVNTLPLLKSLMGRHRREVALSQETLKALVDPHMLQQVIFNLVANACQAMESDRSGEISISTFREGNRIQIRIQDTGPGIKEELLREIFEPFFTTKPVGQGTGLGLSLSLNVIRGFGGEIRVDESYKDGAAFVITLPLSE